MVILHKKFIMIRILKILTLCAVIASAIACGSQKPQYNNRAKKILAEINDPDSKYVVVISHRGDWEIIRRIQFLQSSPLSEWELI